MSYTGEMDERRYLLPHRPAPGRRTTILWSSRTPRPIPVVFGKWSEAPDGVRAEYDRDEFARALRLWQAEFGVQVDVAAVLAEVFG